jgi:cysteine synthase A
LNGKVDAFVAAIGTGGTITGVGRYLREQLGSAVRIVAVEPSDSPLLSEGHAGPHKIQGIGANFVPDVLDQTIYDEIKTVTTDDAIATSRALAAREGIFVGISAGANVWVAIEVAKAFEEPANVVTILPDTGERYLSHPLWEL